MSYETWSTYGYGICASDVQSTEEKIIALLESYPKTRQYVQDMMRESFKSPSEFDLIEDLEGEYGESGIAFVIFHAINELAETRFGCSNEFLTFATDFDGQQYVLYEPSYPWSLPEYAKSLTRDSIQSLFAAVCDQLTDESVFVDYLTVTNGG